MIITGPKLLEFSKRQDLLTSYLKNHNQKVLLYNGNISEALPVEVGVPQGSILGSIFFIIFINDLPFSVVVFWVYIFNFIFTFFKTFSFSHNISNFSFCNFLLLPYFQLSSTLISFLIFSDSSLKYTISFLSFFLFLLFLSLIPQVFFLSSLSFL